MKMPPEQFKERINRIDECVGVAKGAIKQGPVSPELRQSVEQLHQQTRQARQQVQGSGGQRQMGQEQLQQVVSLLEQSADRAKKACSNARSVDPQTQQAVERAHDEISNLKKQMQMG